MDLKARTLDCVRRATWIELSQGQEARDHHLAFLQAWDSTPMSKFSHIEHLHLMWLVTVGPTPPGWQQNLPLDSRYALLHKMYVLSPTTVAGNIANTKS